MKIISFINLKGGVGKTISAINFAYTLVSIYGMRVLLVDNDKQGNVSKFFGLHGDDVMGIAELMTKKSIDIGSVIKNTEYSGLDIITSNMNLLYANMEVLVDTMRPQQTRLKKAFKPLEPIYDYCIIDNAPDINMSVINALAISNDILVPIKVDNFAFDGLIELLEQIEIVQEYNPELTFRGCFITMYQQNNVNVSGNAWLAETTDYPLFQSRIRKTVKVDETTFAGKPLLVYSKNCTAAKDYESLVAEYLERGAKNG